MMNFENRPALQAYNNTGLQGIVEEASPHALVRLLMDGALDRIAAARGQMTRGQRSGKAMSIGRAIDIIETLRASLDTRIDAELVANLEQLYDYMVRRLALANAHDDAAALDEVAGLLGSVRGAWLQIDADAGLPAADAVAAR